MKKFGLSFLGTSQIWFIAFWVAWTTPRPAQRAVTMPTVRATASPVIACTSSAIVGPTIGNWASAESMISCWSWGLLASTMPSTLTNTSMRGNTEKKP